MPTFLGGLRAIPRSGPHCAPKLNSVCILHVLSKEAQGPSKSMVQYHLRRKEIADLMDLTSCAMDEIVDLIDRTSHSCQWHTLQALDDVKIK